MNERDEEIDWTDRIDGTTTGQALRLPPPFIRVPGTCLAKAIPKSYFPPDLRSSRRRSSGVEQRIRNAWVRGSNPFAGTIFFDSCRAIIGRDGLGRECSAE